MKIKGLKKAVGDYQRANENGRYSPWYGCLMLDRGTGELWTDTFYNLGHNSWNVYHDKAIVNIGKYLDEVNMKTVKEVAVKLCEEWRNEEK